MSVKPEPHDHGPGSASGISKAMDARDELKVLANRKILVQAESLGHVSDPALDRVGGGTDVKAEAGAAPCIRSEQPTQQADGCGLAGAVRPNETVDRPALDLHGEFAHDLPSTE